MMAAARQGHALRGERRDNEPATEPTGLPNCGPSFRHPPGDHAARLSEAAGVKGTCIGGADVSPKLANFIVNTGNASARDIALLIDGAQSAVERHSGIRLIPEVRRVGELSS